MIRSNRCVPAYEPALLVWKRKGSNMADAEKESQRAALHNAIWGIADEVRGAVDGWDFKM